MRRKGCAELTSFVTHFTVITPASRIEAEEAKRKMLERMEKKRLETTNFYMFQQRERQKEEQADLLKKFEEDRQKVVEMRAKRGRFVPES